MLDNIKGISSISDSRISHLRKKGEGKGGGKETEKDEH